MSKYDNEDKHAAPIMDRTKIQLATTYSPGSLFTFESHLVICESINRKNYTQIEIKDYARSQIFKSIDEKIHAWYESARTHSDVSTPSMCVDKAFLNEQHSDIKERLDERNFGFVEPNIMGYEPMLLTFACSSCQLVKYFDNLKDFYNKRNELNAGHCGDDHSRRHTWHQLDIVFIHPNGEMIAPKPWKWGWDQRTGNCRKDGEFCSHCGSKEVRLDSRASQIGMYFFYCANCKVKRDSPWLQNSNEYMAEFGRRTAGLTISDVRMRPISCRATSVHLPIQDMVIDFGNSDKLNFLRNNDLIEKYIIQHFSIPGGALSEDEKMKIIKERRGEAEWNSYIQQRKALEDQKKSGGDNKVIVDALEQLIQQKEKIWNEENIFPNNANLPSMLRDNIRLRHEIFASKFNPFKLLVEHEALLDKCVNDQLLSSGYRRFTPLDDLDKDIGPDNSTELSSLNERHRNILNSIGIEKFGLVREFKTYHYSFGYTRVASTPFVEYINRRIVPVRLNLFQRSSIDNEYKHPIFVLKQDNEAIYVKLKENHVKAWLDSIHTNEGVGPEAIGLQYLLNVPEMATFLDSLPRNDSLQGPQFSLALYTLLHTFAHHVMLSISEYSGLGIGSLGEYLFPADLAFIIYRRGMTMDLGNLNSMLRNNAPAFLEHLANRRTLACGSGSLCLHRGGACPDCILIPEVSCITQNKLLSRSVLIGKDHPMNYGFNQPINGYFDIVQAHYDTHKI